MLLVSPDGPPVIVVSGAAVETVKLRVAAVASVLPAASRARTLNVYVPSASGPTARGDVQATYVPTVEPGPSRRHSNVELGSVLVNSNDGDALLVVPVGPAVIVVSGATVSTVNARDAGVGSTLPTASIARTKNVYAPLAVVVYACGDVHVGVRALAGAACPGGTGNVEPTSVPENRNDCAVVLTVPDGPPLIVVSGGPVSTEKLRGGGCGIRRPGQHRSDVERVVAVRGRRERRRRRARGVGAGARRRVQAAFECRGRLVGREREVRRRLVRRTARLPLLIVVSGGVGCVDWTTTLPVIVGCAEHTQRVGADRVERAVARPARRLDVVRQRGHREDDVSCRLGARRLRRAPREVHVVERHALRVAEVDRAARLDRDAVVRGVAVGRVLEPVQLAPPSLATIAASAGSVGVGVTVTVGVTVGVGVGVATPVTMTWPVMSSGARCRRRSTSPRS